MVVAVVLANEYPVVAGRLNFILQVASHARDNDYFIVVNEYFKFHFEDIIAGTTERFYQELEMNRLSEEDIRNIDFCFVPDNYLHTDDWRGSRTSYLLHEYNEIDKEAVTYIIKEVDKALKKRGLEKPEYIINNVQITENIRELARHYKCQLIPYVFSAIRMPHGYSQTLYMAHFGDNLFNVNTAKEMYKLFDSSHIPIDILTRREIIALIGKKRNMNLLPLLDIDGIYEVAYSGEGRHIIPQAYQYDKVTDDDIFYDINQYYGLDSVVARLHPIQMKQARFDQRHMKNDPASFLLSAKRMATVQSQISVKAALWNRTVCIYGDALPFSFLMKNRITDKNKLSENDLNFLLFCYFVPSSLMFSNDYWKWRMNSPDAADIYMKHLLEICNNLGIEESVLYSNDRETIFMKMRGLSDSEISETKLCVSSDELNYDYLSSHTRVNYSDGTSRDYYVLNRIMDEEIVSRFEIEYKKPIANIELILLDDLDGFIDLKSVVVDDKNYDFLTEERYVKKNESCVNINDIENIGISSDVLTIEVRFTAKTFFKRFI